MIQSTNIPYFSVRFSKRTLDKTTFFDLRSRELKLNKNRHIYDENVSKFQNSLGTKELPTILQVGNLHEIRIISDSEKYSSRLVRFTLPNVKLNSADNPNGQEAGSEIAFSVIVQKIKPEKDSSKISSSCNDFEFSKIFNNQSKWKCINDPEMDIGRQTISFRSKLLNAR